MVILWLIIIGAVILGALFMFGVWKNRPRRIEIVVWILLLLSLLSMRWMSLNNDDLEEVANTQFENATDFLDCFSEWVDAYSNDYVYTASEKMIECATDFIEDTTKVLEKYQEYLDL